MRRYTILLDPDPEDGSYTVTVPALPGIVTQGRDLEDAIGMAKDAIRCHIDGLLKDGEPIPEEEQPPKLLSVEVDEPAA
ncbi:MAG: type II toxin-antitoxin system HicB family antitoxin [Bacteroidetes bacterium]|nr:type II toxin-antitoxin system HicB family antitoxin [Bacteroidota bacterium]